MIAWLETVAVRIGILMLLQIGVTLGRTFTIWTDNSTTLATIKQFKSHITMVNKEWKIIKKILLSHNIDIHPRRVTFQENRADSLSRGVSQDHALKDRMELYLPID